MDSKCIILEAIDRSGKDTLRRYIVQQSNGNYLVMVRSFISQVAYARIYNRQINEDYFINQALECQKLGHIFIYLICDTSLIQERIENTNEKHLKINDVIFHKQIFQDVIDKFVFHGLLINFINTTDQDLNRMYKEIKNFII